MNRLPATLEDSVGPFYPRSFVDQDRTDLVNRLGLIVRAQGTAIRLVGTIYDVDHAPVVPALLEFWQADAAGMLHDASNRGDATLDPWFQGWSRHYCNDGTFELRTVKPGTIAARPERGEVARAPHVTLSIFCDGISRIATQVFFDDEPGNATDPLLASVPDALRPRLIAQRQADIDGEAVYRLDIIMRGEGETPFFDDYET